MLGVALLVALVCCFMEVRVGAETLQVVLICFTTFFVVQLSYVLGGLILTLRLRHMLTKKNAKAWRELR